MARTLTAAFGTAIDLATLRLAILSEFDFSGGITRFWSGVGNLSWNTYTWAGAGTFGGLSNIDEAVGVQAPGLRFELSGIDSAQISQALTDDYQGRSAKAWLALFDASDVLIADPVLIFSGLMDVMQINDAGATSTISLQCEGRNLELTRNRELRYTDTEQDRLFAGDLGLQYVASLQDNELAWGVTNARGTAPPRDREAGYFVGEPWSNLP